MLDIEAKFDVAIAGKRVSELTSVRAIRSFLSAQQPGGVSLHQPGLQDSGVPGQGRSKVIHRGLADIYFDRTSITNVDAQGDALRYRGYSVDDLADNTEFEEASFVLIYGSPPDSNQLAAHSSRLRALRPIPEPARRVLAASTGLPPFNALQAGVAALADPALADPDDALGVIAQLPTLVSSYHRLRSGAQPLDPKPELGHAANYTAFTR